MLEARLPERPPPSAPHLGVAHIGSFTHTTSRNVHVARKILDGCLALVISLLKSL